MDPMGTMEYQQADDTVRLWHLVGDHGPVPRLGLVRIGNLQ